MTTYQSLIISPFTWLARKKHFVWYAHKSRPFALNIVYHLTSGILTSTPGSFPFSGKKIHPIGQGIDFQMFPPNIHREYKNLNFVHFGRFDQSKNLLGIINALQIFKSKYPNLALTIIGTPARPESKIYKEEIQDYIRENDMNEWIEIKNSVSRALLSSELENFNIFIHNFRGSLDKTLLEATAMCLDVITTNLEFIKEFGSWSNFIQPNLLDEIGAYLDSSYEIRKLKGSERRKLVTEKHSYDSWVKKTSNILKSTDTSFRKNSLI
jgi:glycosyltransferase involved in cell wall biosynthesis